MDTFIIGAACTHFGKYPNKSFKQLTREAFDPVITMRVSTTATPSRISTSPT